MLERRADEGACSDDPQARPRRCAVALSNARNSMVPFFSTSPSKGETYGVGRVKQRQERISGWWWWWSMKQLILFHGRPKVLIAREFEFSVPDRGDP